MAIKIGGTTVVDDSRNYNVGIATFNELDVPINVLIFSPAIGATAAAIDSNIVLTFNQSVAIGTTGSIRIREGSASGVAIQTIGITSSSVTLSSTGVQVTIDPPVNLGYGKTYYPVIDGGAFRAKGSPSSGGNAGTGRTSSELNTYYFKTTLPNLGDTICGGKVFCLNGGVAWIVSPCNATTRDTWYNRGNANTTAEQITGVIGGWFVPSISQLQSGAACKTYWGGWDNTAPHWSDTIKLGGNAYVVYLNSVITGYTQRNFNRPIRSFRCLLY